MSRMRLRLRVQLMFRALVERLWYRRLRFMANGSNWTLLVPRSRTRIEAERSAEAIAHMLDHCSYVILPPGCKLRYEE